MESKMVSPLFLKRVGYFLCTCNKGNNSKFDFKFTKNINLYLKEIYYESKSIISTQRSLYEWFDESLKNPEKTQISIKRLNCFKQIVEELKQNGKIDSGTKIALMSLLKDLDSFNFSKLRQVTNEMEKKNNMRQSVFFSKLVKLKFDLKICSAKEFCQLLNNIDNCVVKYIEITNNCKICIRDINKLTIKHFMGQMDVTIESRNEKNLYRAEMSLKRLADAIHYRLTKLLPASDTIVGSSNKLKILLQSPPHSAFQTPNDSINDSSILSNH